MKAIDSVAKVEKAVIMAALRWAQQWKKPWMYGDALKLWNATMTLNNIRYAERRGRGKTKGKKGRKG